MKNTEALSKLGTKIQDIYINGIGIAIFHFICFIILTGVQIIAFDSIDLVGKQILGVVALAFMLLAIYYMWNAKNHFTLYKNGFELRNKNKINTILYDEVDYVTYVKKFRILTVTSMFFSFSFVNEPYIYLKNGEKLRVEMDATVFLDEILQRYFTIKRNK